MLRLDSSLYFHIYAYEKRYAYIKATFLCVCLSNAGVKLSLRMCLSPRT
jgi:hypothetical protein